MGILFNAGAIPVAVSLKNVWYTKVTVRQGEMGRQPKQDKPEDLPTM
jgi:hypothetical protein